MYRSTRGTSKLIKKASLYSLSGFLAFGGLAFALMSGDAGAAQLTQSLVRFDSLKTSAFTTGTVCAKPTTVAAENSVQVVFPTGYSLGAAGTFTVDVTNRAWPVGAAAWTSIGNASAVSSQTVTFPSGDLASTSTLYCFNWTNSAAVQVKSSASSSNTGTITTRDSVPATIDTASYSTASINSDQINVSATVPQAFSFALSGNTDALGNLSTGSVTTSPSPNTVTVNTNAASGWMVWAMDSNTGLHSNIGSATIASTTPGTNSTLSSGTEGYNLGVTTTQGAGSGTITAAAPFVGSSAGQGGGLDTSLRTVVSSNGTASNAVLTLKNNVAIGTLTTAATDYADTITVVGAGLF